MHPSLSFLHNVHKRLCRRGFFLYSVQVTLHGSRVQYFFKEKRRSSGSKPWTVGIGKSQRLRKPMEKKVVMSMHINVRKKKDKEAMYALPSETSNE